MSYPIENPGLLKSYIGATRYRGRWFLLFELASGDFAFVDNHFLWFLSPLNGSDSFHTADEAIIEAERLIDVQVDANG